MYEKINNCPTCNHIKFNNYKIVKDHSISGESFALVQCDNCGLIITNPRPDKSHIGKFYESENYISHSNSSNGLVSILYKAVRSYTLNSKIRLIKKYNPNPKLLDYGCGTGHFLNKCQSINWDVNGIEPNPNANDHASSNTGLNISSDLSQLPNNDSFDIITAWHVLEHVHDLNDTFSNLKKALTTSGHMFVALPNYKSADAQHYDSQWAGYDVPRHLYHFSQRTISTFIKKHKMTIVDTVPMPFDAYYVSLLSEKYKGKSDLFEAFSQGYDSNKKAKLSTDYSSLIYVIKK
ncbi:MAG: class I SAM-dependent methyltransferase [Cyclobacteriaceae bacterium]